MIDFALDRNVHKESRLQIELVGTSDIFRFAVNMLGHQVEFMAAGRAILVELREAVGPDRFDPWAVSMLGADRYEILSPYFLRDADCVACERDLGEDYPRRKLPGAKVVCIDCDRNDMPVENGVMA